ncbi:MAG: bifunctional riboflavin kinase/FAD synthetase [Lachnospiraceae bacterium]
MIYLNGEKAKQFKTENTAIALGKFDGIHIGHQLLMEGLKKEKTKGRNTLVFSFGIQPGTILNGEERKNIYTTEEKVQYFRELDIDILLEYPFTKEFASFMPEDFVKTCLVEQLGVKCIYVGEDFRFGKNRSGNLQILKELGKKYNFTVYGIPKKQVKDEIVSSTTIRSLLEHDFSYANTMLGNPYFVYGPVVHGNHLGNTIGFPTINQEIGVNKIVPKFGVYASRILFDDKKYYGISNLGIKPTIDSCSKIGLETYIFDFNENLYGQHIKTELLCFIRKEMKFDSIDKLKQQIKKDIVICKEKILDNNY